MDTDAVKHLEGNVSNDDIMGIEKTYCKHSNAAKKICGEHHLTMTQCNKKLDVRGKSKIYSVCVQTIARFRKYLSGVPCLEP